MSYLSPNRFAFAGTFQADVSTVNNVSSNYGETTDEPVWNPKGTGGWKFQGCTVKSAVLDSAPDPGDPIVGMAFTSTNQPAEAKLVDLDPQQQMVSEIWGMKLALGNGSGANAFTGNFRVAAFCDGWGRNPRLGRGSAAMSAFYQSVIEDVEWSDDLTSPVLQQLADGGDTRILSIKFNVDMHNNFARPPGSQGPTPPGYPVDTYPFTFGRVVGTIGPYDAGDDRRPAEPLHFVSGRLLRAGRRSPMYFAPCVVESGRIFVDLGNSTPANPDGSIVDLGHLRLAILDPNATERGATAAMKSGTGGSGTPPQHIFPKPLETASYTTDASIQEVPFDSSLCETLENAPLGIVQVDEAGDYLKTLLAEAADGWFMRADRFVYRLNPSQSAKVCLRATRFGLPAPDGTEISLQKAQLGSNDSRPRSGAINNDELADLGGKALALNGSLDPQVRIVTQGHGWAELEMKGLDPGYPRREGTWMIQPPTEFTFNLDGVLYRVVPTLTGSDGENPDPWLFISLQVYTDWSKVANDFDQPTWNGDLEAVFGQYGWLYPFMDTLIDMSEYQTTPPSPPGVQQAIDHILARMRLPRTDPKHMPVTRDFSESKLKLVENWKANGTPE